MKRFSIILISVLFIASLNAQEILSNLYQNPVLVKESMSPKSLKNTKAEMKAMTLPFFDDFREKQPYPSENLWVDSFAYVNRDFQLYPPNIGVATLDAINQYGKVYSNASPYSFVADYLTSRPIRLDSVFGEENRPMRKKDSLYFSFYYQPQGRGNNPEAKDSLVLEFLTEPEDTLFTPNDTIVVPADTIYDIEGNIVEIIPEHDSIIEYDPIIIAAKWNRIWSSAGMPIDTFYKYLGDYNQQVLIPIQDSATYYRKDFQFRFFNYASIADDILPSWQSNADNWNIDYVYLNKGRSAGDSIYPFIGFSEKPQSFLKYYQAMPYNQYSNNPTNEMQDTVHNYITNLDTSVYLGSYEYKVLDGDGEFVYGYDGGNYPVYPYVDSGFVTHQPFAEPPVEFILPVDPFGQADSAEFTVRHIIISDVTPSLRLGDTVDFVQKMTNYYAYDDGSAEAGYGLTPAGARMAYRFRINTKDTLRAVDFFFNNTLNGGNEQYFNLTVWRDNNGIPGNIINTEQVVKSEFEDGLNRFVRYYFDEPVPVSNSFYVGWIQTTDDNLNVGFDRSRNAQENIYFNIEDQWFTSQFEGCLMIRPVMGRQIKEYPVKGNKLPDNLTVWPNPVPENQKSLKFSATPETTDPEKLEQLNIRVYNILGKLMYESSWVDEIPLSNMSSGMYILRVSNKSNGETHTIKFIIGAR